MATITVPAAPRARAVPRKASPPMGTYTATLLSVVELTDLPGGRYTVKFRLRHPDEGQYTLTGTWSAAVLLEWLRRQGVAGDVDTDALGGTKGEVYIQSRGNRRSYDIELPQE